MIPHQETRRLAAVMFADIEGYTSLFQRNESAAIKQVNDHRKDLEQATRKYKGDIIQFYGDGSATVYESVIDAVKSAIEIQHLSAKHRIPVRIGLHMGDLIFKDGDIFGDVVNVASRIQSAGIPGSVLVSKKIVEELNNHPEIHTVRIGMFSLKNVKESLELFAVTAPGLSIPAVVHQQKKKRFALSTYLLAGLGMIIFLGYLVGTKWFSRDSYLLGNERICIPPFKDFTSNPDYDSIGFMASSIISKALSETADAEVVSYESLIRYFNSDLTPITFNSSLARKAGAEYALEGNYSLLGERKDTLYFWASIIDLRTRRTVPIPIPSVYCPTSNFLLCVEEMAGNLKGYWKSKGDHVFRIPNEKAWAAYLRAQKLWADPDHEQEAKQYLLEAIGHDSSFLDAYFLLLDAFNNENAFSNEADTLELIRKLFPDMDARQENYLRYYEEDLNGRNAEAWKYYKKEYANDPGDLFINTTGMVIALEYLNDPETALLLNQEIASDSLDLNVCVYCRTRVALAMQAFEDLGDKKNANKLAEQLRPYAEKPAQLTRLIKHYVSAGDTAAVNEMIMKGVKAGSKPDDEQYYCLIAARYAMINGNINMRDRYATRAIQLYGSSVNRTKARCHYLLGDYARAEKIYLAEISLKPDDSRLRAELGMIYSRQGNTAKAEEIISLLGRMKRPYGYGETEYFQARIKALAGEKEAAIALLQRALDDGMKFRVGTTFQHDPDLMALNTSPEYAKLLERYRQP